MDTPLKQVRIAKKVTLAEVASAVECHHGHLSRIENGAQCSPELAEKLVKYFGSRVISELKILYPERYMTTEQPST